ncbi:MAG TPA: ATP-binding cassette domain-containing protein, partial [Bacteroidota bacterium]|nr:ATP-binding cassette domain-containing protein [Bacteroidota bacterium]
AVGVGKVYLTYQGISGALEKTYQLMGTVSVRPPEGPMQLQSIHGGIEFRNVSYHYVPEHPVLRNVSFRIEPGSTILLRGDSGSGKTTLVNLMVGLLNPVEGNITLDGYPLPELERSSLHRAFGYVGQDPLLFHGTLEENIFFSGLPTVPGRLQEALRISCVDEILEDLPRGLSTIVGERGFTLSGGQRARVAIARAIIHRPAVLILDEASSMLGEDLERKLWDRLLGDRRGLTTIILSHHHEHLPEGFSEWHLDYGMVRHVGEASMRKS